jgi:hypothetical protein
MEIAFVAGALILLSAVIYGTLHTGCRNRYQRKVSDQIVRDRYDNINKEKNSMPKSGRAIRTPANSRRRQVVRRKSDVCNRTKNRFAAIIEKRNQPH